MEYRRLSFRTWEWEKLSNDAGGDVNDDADEADPFLAGLQCSNGCVTYLRDCMRDRCGRWGHRRRLQSGTWRNVTAEDSDFLATAGELGYRSIRVSLGCIDKAEDRSVTVNTLRHNERSSKESGVHKAVEVQTPRTGKPESEVLIPLHESQNLFIRVLSLGCVLAATRISTR